MDATRAFYTKKLVDLQTLREAVLDAADLADKILSAERGAPAPDEELVGYLAEQLGRLESFEEVLAAEVSAVLPLTSGS